VKPYDWAEACPDLVGPDWATFLVAAIVAVTAAVLVALVAWLTVLVLA